MCVVQAKYRAVSVTPGQWNLPAAKVRLLRQPVSSPASSCDHTRAFGREVGSLWSDAEVSQQDYVIQ